jgi:hypothetical protein
MRSDFNLRGDQSHRHPERSEAKPKDPAKLAVTLATGFLDLARNDNRLTRKQARLAQKPDLLQKDVEQYAGNDCRAGQGRDHLRGWRVQARR